MKDNVDLTENRDFRKTRDLTQLLLNFCTKNVYPWSIELLAQYDKDKEIFHTGNKEERKSKRGSDNYYVETECECCGEDMSKKPWNSYYRLCIPCSDRLDKGINGDKLWR